MAEIKLNLEEYLDKAKEAALEAGKLIRKVRDSGELGIETKENQTPVTKADKEAEEIIRNILLDAFPGSGFVGEESEPIIGSNGFKWSCDPIDGTHCFINGEKTAAVSLAMYWLTELVLGVVYNPFTHEMYSGARGIASKLNDKPLPLFPRKNIGEGVVDFRISRRFSNDVSILYNLYKDRKIGKLISTGGSTAYGLVQVAEGSHSVYIIRPSKDESAFDFDAGIYLIRSRGGLVTDLEGKNIDLNRVNGSGCIVASTDYLLQDETLKLLRKAGFGNGK